MKREYVVHVNTFNEGNQHWEYRGEDRYYKKSSMKEAKDLLTEKYNETLSEAEKEVKKANGSPKDDIQAWINEHKTEFSIYKDGDYSVTAKIQRLR